MQRNTMLDLQLSSWKFADFCALYIIIWAIAPILSHSALYRYIAVAASIIVTYKVFFESGLSIRNYVIFSFILTLQFFINIGYIVGNLESAVSRSLNLFVFCILGLVSIYYFTMEREKFIVLSGIVIVLYAIIAIPSIIALQSNRWILRNASGKTLRTGIELFAGGYGYSFGCLFLTIFLIYDLRVNEYRGFRLFIRAGLVFLFGFIVLNAGYTTALVLFVIGVFAAIFFPKDNSVMAALVMMIAAFVLIQAVPVIMGWMIEHFDFSDVYRTKIYYLAQLMNTSNSVTYTDSTRGAMFYESLVALSQNPILGSIYLRGKETAAGHAVLLDTLVNHGILFFFLYIYVIVLVPWQLTAEDKTLQKIYLVMIVLLGFTDTFDYTTMTIPLFVAPMIADHSAEIRRIES